MKYLFESLACPQMTFQDIPLWHVPKRTFHDIRYLFGLAPAECDVGLRQEVAEAFEGGGAVGTRVGGVRVQSVEAQSVAAPLVAWGATGGVLGGERGG